MLVIARPRLVADAGHVVLEGAGRGLELPPEQRAPELASLRGVVGRDLEVHDLTGHLALLWHQCGPADAAA
jgi:hypothetical protein